MAQLVFYDGYVNGALEIVEIGVVLHPASWLVQFLLVGIFCDCGGAGVAGVVAEREVAAALLAVETMAVGFHMYPVKQPVELLDGKGVDVDVDGRRFVLIFCFWRGTSAATSLACGP